MDLSFLSGTVDTATSGRCSHSFRSNQRDEAHRYRELSHKLQLDRL